MSLSLIKRATNGAPLTAAQHDTNMTNIETAVNTNSADISNKANTSTVLGYFYGLDGFDNKGQVAFSHVQLIPSQFINPGVTKIVKSAGDQNISATGTVSVTFNTTAFDYSGNANLGSGVITTPYPGVYLVGASAQVELVSGSPTAVSIIASIKQNGSTVSQATLDNSGTGTRIYKLSTPTLSTAGGDEFTLVVDFTFSGTATWKVAANNTDLWMLRQNTYPSYP